MLLLVKKTQNDKPLNVYYFVFFLLLNFGFISPSQALEKKLSFQDFLNLHYQSQTKPLPAIPAFTTLIATPVITPYLKILGPEPRSVVIPEPSLNILGEHEEQLALTPPIITPQLVLGTESPTHSLTTQNNISHLPKLAIVIDDIGNNKSLDSRVAHLPGAVTLAILPHTPHSKTIAELAYAKQKEIMLHAPMESLQGRRLGDGALTKDLSDDEFMEVLQSGIDSIPHVSGLNNHMGSALTQDSEAMHLVMQAIVKNQLYFVDSRTTPESVAGDLATAYKIDHVSRNVFLDNETDYAYIDQAFKEAIRISKKTGFALAIGHPYPETIAYLESVLPDLEKQEVMLISVSDLLKARAERKNETVKDLAKNE